MTTSTVSDWRPEKAIEVAESVATWLNQYKRTTADGTAWSRAAEQPDSIVRTLYAGSAGIAIFLLELHRSTGKASPLQDAVACGHDLVAYVQRKDTLPCAMFSGWAGYAFALTELYKASGEPGFKESAAYCLEQLTTQASKLGNGLGWIEPMPFADITGMTGDREIYDASVGAAGAGMVYLYALENGIYPDGLDIARAVGDRLLEVGEPMPVGTQWRLMNDMPFDFSAPNFAHGGAGVAYFLARLYQHTGAAEHLAGAVAGAEHVQNIAFSHGEGQLVCHQKEGKNPNAHYYLGQCHGPAGTARLYHLLNEITGEAQWLEFADQLMLGLRSTGAPEQRGFGLWNNISQCCCDAGIGDYALYVYKARGDEQAFKLALRVADELCRRAVTDNDGTRWPQAEHRARPDFEETQTGYMQGAAGVGSFFLHLASVLAVPAASASPTKIAFADNPFR
ncbi:MAG: lanthionine synthetase LanC family protein [Pseudomonadota bacterium]